MCSFGSPHVTRAPFCSLPPPDLFVSEVFCFLKFNRRNMPNQTKIYTNIWGPKKATILWQLQVTEKKSLFSWLPTPKRSEVSAPFLGESFLLFLLLSTSGFRILVSGEVPAEFWPRGGGALSLKFAQNYRKTAWFWKKSWGQGGKRGPSGSPPGSASVNTCMYFLVSDSIADHGRILQLCSGEKPLEEVAECLQGPLCEEWHAD